MKERLCLLKRLYAKKTFTVALTLAAFFVFTASSANAQCTRPITYVVGPDFGEVGWLVDENFSDYCSNGWSTSGGARRVTGSEVCGWSNNQYVKFSKPQFSNTGQLSQTFTHDGFYTGQYFYLGFQIAGSISQDVGSTLDVSIYNVTDNTWTFVDRFNYTNTTWCQNKGYSFYKPEWRGKQLRVVFKSTIYSSTTNWSVDGVTLEQSEYPV
jgi:hypothetical protein